MDSIVWIKNIEHRDIEFLVILRNYNRKYFFDTREVTIESTREWFIKHVMSTLGNREYFIIMKNTEKVGSISINYQTGEIGHVAVLPFIQREGIGKEAMKIAIDLLKSRFPNKIPFVEVKLSNDSAYTFYYNLGFRVTRQRMELSKNEHQS